MKRVAEKAITSKVKAFQNITGLRVLLNEFRYLYKRPDSVKVMTKHGRLLS